MDLELTEDQKAAKQNLRRFLEREISPFVEEYERAQRFVGKQIVKKLVPFGLIGGLLPEEDGGAGLDYITYFLLIEEVARIWPSLRSVLSITSLVATNIHRHGTEEQKSKYLEPLLSGDKFGFFALTEPNVGSDASSVQTTAKLTGEGWILNGTKMFITNGISAEVGIVIAQTDKSKGPDGITAFIVEKELTSYSTKPIDKMGNHCCPTAEIVFEDALVPKDAVLGKVGQGLRLGLTFLNEGRVLIAFACAGVAEACLEASIKYAQQRTQFGKPIGSFQLIQAKLADMITLTNAMRLLGFQAAYLLDRKFPCRKEASMAKLFSTEAVLRVADSAIQIHGGYGYSREFPVERYYRDIRHLAIAEGTNEIQRLVIGRELTGLAAFV